MSYPLLSRLKAHQCNCLNCGELFIPDARNRHHQKYCEKESCRKASKHAAQRRWLNSEKGTGYYCGDDNKRRVKEWREKNPGYWKRQKGSSTESAIALQDLSNSQDVENRGVQEISQKDALQDLYLLQPALIIGLISTMTGSTLQDDIAATGRRLIDSGRDILGCGKAMQKQTTS